ncbi:MAG: multicopper oxidase domain-containing protein [Minicystis sp.]
MEFRDPEDVLTLHMSDAPAASPPPMPSVARAIAPLDLGGATPVSLELTQSPEGEPFALGINGVPSWEADPLVAMVGETQVWTITNNMAWAHPFHLHGFFFQVLGDAKAPAAPLEWKDTADVPVNGVLKLAVRYDDRPGMWMFHCHILDHAEAGMMGMLMLEPH